MNNTKIEWAHATFNPWWGCTKISTGCAHCYAERDSKRFHGGLWGADATRKMMSDAYWKQPLLWNKQAEKSGEPFRVFGGSMCDIFEDRNELDNPRWMLFDLIYKTPNLIWMLCTKRPENITKLFSMIFGHNQMPNNVWLLTSVENQEQAEKRIPELLKISAKVHGLSCEPLLGPVDLQRHMSGIDWVIVGGESGPQARPMNYEWAKSLHNECEVAGIPFFFKQWGEWSLRHTQIFPGYSVMYRVGKKAAGRLLDGQEYSEFPKIATT